MIACFTRTVAVNAPSLISPIAVVRSLLHSGLFVIHQAPRSRPGPITEHAVPLPQQNSRVSPSKFLRALLLRARAFSKLPATLRIPAGRRRRPPRSQPSDRRRFHVRGDRPILIAQPRIGIRFQQKADNFPHRNPSLRHRITPLRAPTASVSTAPGSVARGSG